jgi:Ca-activated chloride channel homolog
VNRPTRPTRPNRPNRPNRHSAASHAALFVLALFSATAAQTATATEPQAEPAQPVGEFNDQLSVSWVLVPVLARTHDGYLDDLERDDFRLFVDGERVPIADFESGATAPVSLVFLQDLSGSMANGDKLTASKRALAYLLSRSRPDDEFALASFAGGQLQVEVPFTHDGQVISEAMELWQGYGTTAIHDAVGWIPQIAVTGRHPKRAAVLVSDGLDNASQLTPEAAQEIVRRANLPVYVLAIRQLGDPSSVVEADTYARLLMELARRSGGHYFAVDPGEGVTSAAADLLEELRRQYVLAFPTSPGEAAYHRLKVEVSAPSRVTIYHRSGYRGGLPAVAR